jgi:type II secretory pathway component PulM
MKTALKTYYNNLGTRDQKALTVLLGFLGLGILAFGLIMPSYDFYQNGKDNFRSESELLTWITQNKNTLSSTQINPPNIERSHKPLLQQVSNSASKAEIKVNRLQPEGSNKLRIWLTEVEFKKVILWLEKLTFDKAITIEQISMEKHTKPGFVNIQLTLKSKLTQSS